jgi:hypothetical protein
VWCNLVAKVASVREVMVAKVALVKEVMVWEVNHIDPNTPSRRLGRLMDRTDTNGCKLLGSHPDNQKAMEAWA